MKQILLLVSSIILISLIFYHQDEHLSDFEKWQNLYSKFYYGTEKLFREKVYLENQLKISIHNSDPTQTYLMSENQFMTLTNEEYIAIYSSQILPFEIQQDEFLQQQEEILDQEINLNPVDFRDKLIVSNRGNCGADWAFSVTGAIDALYMLTKNQKIASSPQELIDCDTNTQHGCLGGTNEYAIESIKNWGGISSNQSYPYRGSQYSCTPKTHLYKISKSTHLTQDSDTLQKSLQTSALSVGVDTRNWQFYKSGVFSNCDTVKTGYALLVGFDENRNWILQNSLGNNWGMNGSIILNKGNTCGILLNAYEIR